MMGSNLSTSELRYGGGPLSPEERELLGPIEWLTQLRGLDKCWTKQKPAFRVPIGKKGRNAGVLFRMQQGEARRSQIIEYLLRAEHATTLEIAKFTGISDTSVRSHMMILVGKGIARRIRFDWVLV